MEFIFHCMAVTKIMIPLDFSKFSRRKVTKGVYRAFFFSIFLDMLSIVGTCLGLNLTI